MVKKGSKKILLLFLLSSVSRMFSSEAQNLQLPLQLFVGELVLAHIYPNLLYDDVLSLSGVTRDIHTFYQKNRVKILEQVKKIVYFNTEWPSFRRTSTIGRTQEYRTYENKLFSLPFANIALLNTYNENVVPINVLIFGYQDDFGFLCKEKTPNRYISSYIPFAFIDRDIFRNIKIFYDQYETKKKIIPDLIRQNDIKTPQDLTDFNQKNAVWFQIKDQYYKVDLVDILGSKKAMYEGKEIYADICYRNNDAEIEDVYLKMIDNQQKLHAKDKKPEGVQGSEKEKLLNSEQKKQKFNLIDEEKNNKIIDNNQRLRANYKKLEGVQGSEKEKLLNSGQKKQKFNLIDEEENNKIKEIQKSNTLAQQTKEKENIERSEAIGTSKYIRNKWSLLWDAIDENAEIIIFGLGLTLTLFGAWRILAETDLT